MGTFKDLLHIEKWKTVVLEVVFAIVLIQVLLNVMYLHTPGFWTGFSLLSWNLLVIGADTSFIGMYFGLRAYIGALKLLGRKHRWLVVVGAVGFLAGFQALMNIVFFSFPGVVVGIFNSAAWNLLVLSASTSFLAMYFCIRAYISAVKAMHSAKFFKSGFVKSMLSGSAGEGPGGAINEVNLTFGRGSVKLTFEKKEQQKKESK